MVEMVGAQLGVNSSKAKEIEGQEIFSLITKNKRPLVIADKKGFERKVLLSDLAGGDELVKGIVEAIKKVDYEQVNTTKEKDFMETIKYLDDLIEGMKEQYVNPKDKASIEAVAPDIFGSVLGTLFFSGENLGNLLGDVRRDQLAEFIVRNRAKFLRGHE